MCTKLRWYKFWIHSSRGTDNHTYQRLPHRMDPDDVKSQVEEWCHNFPACHEYQYGWTKIRRPPKTWLRARINILQKIIETQKQQIIELQAML